MTNIYVLTSEKLADTIEVCYSNKLLESIKFPSKYPLTLKQYKAIMEHIPISEEVLEFNMSLINITLQKPTSTHLKIAMFCEKYMEYKNGLKYKAMPADAGKIKLMKITPAILDAYFKSQAFEIVGKDGIGKHSISNLMAYYNLVLNEMTTSPKGKFPDHWSEIFENKLKSQKEINEYWAHLRYLGLEPKKDRVGKTTDWVKII